jgi:hypothetical protein
MCCVLHSHENQNLDQKLWICAHHFPQLGILVKLRRIRCGGYVACMGEMINEYNNLISKPQGKRLLGKHWQRWEFHIKMDVQKTV